LTLDNEVSVWLDECEEGVSPDRLESLRSILEAGAALLAVQRWALERGAIDECPIIYWSSKGELTLAGGTGNKRVVHGLPAIFKRAREAVPQQAAGINRA
jgi:hypothetical protein